MAMATKHSEGGRIVGITSRALRYPSKTNQQQGVLQKGTPRRGESSIQRLNASTRGHSPNGNPEEESERMSRTGFGEKRPTRFNLEAGLTTVDSW
uniref:Uncharacterized protein LOC114333299 isoform X3 n=1 Tax=Diabrotica virgifera virgifera TaxID=50390 RepID=A0A6P7G2X8_DIAVI